MRRRFFTLREKARFSIPRPEERAKGCRILLVCLAGLLAVGCGIFGSSPEPDFYVLYPHEGRAHERTSLQIELRRPALPDYLERPQIVRRVEHGQLALSEDERWGGSLTKMVASTLATNLSRRLPRSEVYNESGSISTSPDLRIEVDFHQFERTPDGNVTLSAQAALHWQSAGDQRAVIERFEQHKAPESNSTEATVAAMSELLGELAEAIAQRVAAGPPAEPATSPTASTP